MTSEVVDIDQVFGDGDRPLTKSALYYFKGLIFRPRTVVADLSCDSYLFRRCWQLVIATTVVALLFEFFEYAISTVIGLRSEEHFIRSMLLLLIAGWIPLLLFPVGRWIWGTLFRFGKRISSAQIAALSACTTAVSQIISVVTVVSTPILIATDPFNGLFGESAIDRAVWLALFLLMVLFPVTAGFYARHTLDLGYLKSLSLSVVLLLLYSLLVLAILLIIGVPLAWLGYLE